MDTKRKEFLLGSLLDHDHGKKVKVHQTDNIPV